jgi:hypothetical protein
MQRLSVFDEDRRLRQEQDEAFQIAVQQQQTLEAQESVASSIVIEDDFVESTIPQTPVNQSVPTAADTQSIEQDLEIKEPPITVDLDDLRQRRASYFDHLIANSKVKECGND